MYQAIDIYRSRCFNVQMISNLKPGLSQSMYVFIDASNLWQAQKSKGRLFDYEKLSAYLKRRFSAAKFKVFYYTAYPAQETRSYDLNGKHRFLTFLKKGLGFAVIKKELKRIRVVDNGAESVIEKGNMDVEITIDVLHHMEKYDTVVFFTGDADFLALVSYLRQRGKKVFIFSSRNNISQELRTGGDGYCDVLTITDDIWGGDLQHRSKAA